MPPPPLGIPAAAAAAAVSAAGAARGLLAGSRTAAAASRAARRATMLLRLGCASGFAGGGPWSPPVRRAAAASVTAAPRLRSSPTPAPPQAAACFAPQRTGRRWGAAIEPGTCRASGVGRASIRRCCAASRSPHAAVPRGASPGAVPGGASLPIAAAWRHGWAGKNATGRNGGGGSGGGSGQPRSRGAGGEWAAGQRCSAGQAHGPHPCPAQAICRAGGPCMDVQPAAAPRGRAEGGGADAGRCAQQAATGGDKGGGGGGGGPRVHVRGSSPHACFAPRWPSSPSSDSFMSESEPPPAERGRAAGAGGLRRAMGGVAARQTAADPLDEGLGDGGGSGSERERERWRVRAPPPPGDAGGESDVRILLRFRRRRRRRDRKSDGGRDSERRRRRRSGDGEEAARRRAGGEQRRRGRSGEAACRPLQKGSCGWA